MIRGMRELSDSYKLSVRTIHEVFLLLHEMDGYALRDQSLQVVNKGKLESPGRAAIVTALLLRIGAMTAEEQKRFLADGLSALNAILEEGEAPAVIITKTESRPPRHPRKKQG